MKKTLFTSLSIVCCCLPIAACGGSNNEQANFFYAYATENLMSDWDYLAEKDEDGQIIEENKEFRARDYKMRFACLKGENESTQLIINAKKYINNFSFELPSVSDGTNTISADNFTTSVAWYQMISGSNERGSYAGYYPDALIPIDAYKYRRMDHIEKGYNQALYFNFTSNENMKAGTYNGTGKLTLDGNTYDIPFEVTIYDGVMPKAVHQRSSYLVWYEQISLGELKNANEEMNLKYYDFIAKKRICPGSLPDSHETTPAIFVEKFVEKVAYNEAIPTYRFPVRANNYDDSQKADYIVNFKAKVKSYLEPLIAKNVELRDKDPNDKVDFFKKFYLYVDDEPGADRYEKVMIDDQIWYEVKQSLAFKLNKYPDLKESFLYMPNLVTTPLNDSLIGTTENGGVQCWCPQYSHFSTAQARQKYAERQALPKDGNYQVTVETKAGPVTKQGRVGGESVWWYGCMDPCSPFPSLHLDADLLNTRALRYMQYNYKIEGCIYWCVCYYSKYTYAGTYGRDIWYDPISWVRCAGDGQLVYPGVTFGIDGPITTLRLEQLLASNEEYEYLWMIEQGVNAYNQEKGTSIDANAQLAKKYFSRIYTDMICGDSDKTFNDVRLEILALASKMSTNRDAAVEELAK